LANTAWAGMLVFSGALFTETYDASARLTGVLLAIGAAFAIAGNRVAHRLPEERLGLALILLGWALAAALALFGSVRLSPATSAVLFSAAAFVAGARTVVSGTLALGMSRAIRHALLAGRAATLQFGYFAGAILGGVALALGGYSALGVILGAVAAAASATLALPRPALRTARRWRRTHALPEACM
jgi:MFS transporter, DHA1 family, inner membrane transport protein